MTSLTRRAFVAQAAAGTATALGALATPTKAQGPVTNSAVKPDASSGTEKAADGAKKLRLGMVVFEGFELLDVFGPLEMFGALREQVSISIIAERAGTVKSSAGPAVVVDRTLAEAGPLDVVMIPGGQGTRREVNNVAFVAAFKALALATPHVASVCTGSAVLARTGLIDGVRATTNKRAYAWATSQGPQVTWVPEARWVEDGKYFTSSGVSAGIDLALGLIEKLFGAETAVRVANGAEYEWNRNPQHDPFAKLNGLVK